MPLTPQQRYRQAIRKSEIMARREMRDFLAGRIFSLPCTGDRERAFVTAEIGRAFEAGRAAALTDKDPTP